MLMLNFLTWAIAVSAFTYSNIITEEGMLLYGFHQWADNKFCGPSRWVFQLLINCQFCIAGQWALWYYLIYSLHRSGHYDLFTHVWFILQTIFMAKVITWLYYTVFKF